MSTHELLSSIRQAAAPKPDRLGAAVFEARQRRVPWQDIAREINAGSGQFSTAAAIAARFTPSPSRRNRATAAPLPGVSVAEAAEMVGVSAPTMRAAIAALPERSPAITVVTRGQRQLVTRILDIEKISELL